MKKMINRASLAALFTSAFTLVLALAPSSAWADTFYGKAVVLASPADGGTVYVNTTNTKPGDSSPKEITTSKSGSYGDKHVIISFYRWAVAAEGYRFMRWSNAGSTSAGDDTEAPSGGMKVYANSKSQSSPSTATYTAIFEQIHYRYGRVTVRPSDTSRGKVYVGNTGEAGELVAGEVSATQGPVESGDSGIDMYFYRWAEAEPGYVFTGWSDCSQEANGSVMVTAESEQVDEPTTLELTANFEVANTYYGQVTVQPNDSSMGEVYVSTTDSLGTLTDGSMTSDVNSGVGGEQNGKVTFYRWAKPKAGYVFRGWSDGGNKSGAVTMISTSKDGAAPATQTWTAIFTAGETSSLQGTAAQFSFSSASPYYADRSGNDSLITIDAATRIDTANVRRGSKGNGALMLANGRGQLATYNGQLGNLACKPPMNLTGAGWTMAVWIRPDMSDTTFGIEGLANNEWSHICFVYDPEKIRAWQNGPTGKPADEVAIVINYRGVGGADTETSVPASKPDQFATALGYVPLSLADDGSFTLGGTIITGVNGTSPQTKTFYGLMDDVVFINRPLTQIETVRLYTLGQTEVSPSYMVDEYDDNASYGFDTCDLKSDAYTFWSSFKAPTADNDYIVDNGCKLMKRDAAVDAEFAGRSLTLGRLQAVRCPGPTSARSSAETIIKPGNFAWNTTGTLTIKKLILNNGTMSAMKGTLAGAVIVQSPASEPYVCSLGGALTINAPMTAATGTALRFQGAQTLTFGEGSLANYAGEIRATDAVTRLVFNDEARAATVRLASGKGGIRGSADGVTLAANIVGAGRLFVAEGETLTLKGSISDGLALFNNAGTPAQSSCGTVVLDGTTGAGTVSLGTSGTVAVKTAGAAANVGTVAGGTVAIESGLGAVTLANASVTGNATVSIALNDGDPDSVTVPAVTAGKKVTIALSGTLPKTAATYTIAMLPAGTSYAVTGLPNLGDEWGVIPAMDNSGVVTVQVALKPSIAEATVSIASKTYSGSAQQPVPVVTFGDYTAVADTDYTISVDGDPVNAGDYTVTISSVRGGFFKPDTSTTATYTIAPRQITSVTPSATSKVYNRGAQNPAATVKYNTTTLTAGPHYTISWGDGDCINVGTYTVAVDGIGNYAGHFEFTYEITAPTKIYLNSTPAAVIYNGTAQRPTVTVRHGNNSGETLVEGTEYTLTFAGGDPVNVGTYTMTIVGIGNYAGATLTVGTSGKNEFKINKGTITVTPVAGQQKTAGAADPVFTYTWAPELAPGVTFEGALGRAAGEAAGEYAYTIGTLKLSDTVNYNAPVLGTSDKFTIVLPADLYVDGVNGSDADGNVGADPTKPCKTISAAVAAVNTAKLTTPITIHVAPGTYVENVPTLSYPMTIIGEGATRDDVIVDGNAAGRAFYLNAAQTVVANLTMRNGKAPSGQDGGTVYINMGGMVTNCVLKGGNLTSGARSGAIAYMTNGNSLLVDSLILGEGEVSLPDGNSNGMAVYLNSGRMSRCVVSNVLYKTANTGRTLTSVYLNNSAIVENSLITHCKSQGSNMAAVYLASAASRVVNCTICNCTGTAAVRTGNADARVVNCAIFDNGNTAGKEWAGVNPGSFINCAFYKAAVNDTLVNGCLGLTDFLMDPENANHPLQQSQLVDAGTDPSAWNAKSETDLDGNPRLGCGAVDIGCYEFTPTGLWCSAKASADETVVGRTVTFNGQGGNGEGELTYTWDFGDGETATGAEVTHIYAAAGRYTVQLTVSDGTSSETCSVPGYLRVFDAEALYVKTTGNNVEGFGDSAHPLKDIPTAFAFCRELGIAPTIYVADNVASLAAQTMPPGVKLVGNAANRARTITLVGVLTMTNELNVVSNLTLQASSGIRMVRLDEGLLTDCKLSHNYNGKVTGNGPVIWQEGGCVSRCQITTGNTAYRGATAATSHGSLVYAAGGVIENSLLTKSMGGAAGVATGALYLTNDAVAVNCTLGNCTTDGLTAGILIGSDEAQAINCLALECGDTAELVWGNTHASQFKNCAFVESAACTGPGCITCPADVLLTVVDTTNFKPVAGVTVDAGDTAAYETHATAAIDLTGNNRQQGASVDIGCYEYDNSTASVIGSTETRHTFLGEEITFAAKSAGTKGDVTYEWNMGNGDIFVTNVESFVYVYQRDTGYLRTTGVFTPKVTVIDDNGRSETVSLPNQIHIAPRKIYVGGGTSVFPYDTPETAAANFNAIASLCRTTSSGTVYDADDLEIVVSGNFTESNSAYTFSGANVKIYSTGPQWAVSLPQTITITGANCEIRNLKLIPTGGYRAISLNSTTAKIEDCYFYKTSTSVVGNNGGLIYMDNGQLIRCRLEGGNIQNSNNRLGANVYAAGNSIIDSCFITGARTGQANVAAGAVCLGGNAKIIGSTVAGNTNLNTSCRGIRLNSATAQAINCAVYNNGGTAATEWGNVNGANFVNCAFAAGCAPEDGTACIETLTDAAFADTVDYVPAAGSVLIGAGDEDAATAAGAVSPTDLAGNPRTVGTRDIGAYERVSTVRATVADLFVTYDAAEHTLAAPTILEPAADVCTVKWADESGAFTLDAPVAQTAAGSYTNTVKIIADGYEDFTGTVVLEIKKRTLTVTVAGKSVTYGNAAPAFTVSYSGWATGEGTGNIDISGLTYECAYEPGTAAGANPKIYADGILADNYAIKYATGTLTVNPRSITVTPDAGQSKEYGAADPELTYTVTSAAKLYGDDTLAGALSREAGETAGDYKITLGTLNSANANYTVSIASTAVYFTINPSENAMILTLAPAGATYNGLDQRPVALVTKSDGVTPLVEGVDYELSGLSAPWVNAGTYTVTATGLGSRAGQSATATYTIARALAPLGNIGFQDKTFDYDGQSHSIVIDPAVLPAGITVTYDGNGKVQPGEYPVTAHFDVGNNYEPVADRTVTMKITRISDWYVATTGSDENAGSDAATPFATIAKAISMVGANDTARIHLADGTYTEFGLTVNRAVEIIGNTEDATKVIIQAAATPVSGSGAACVGTVMTVSHAGAYVHHLTLRNGSVNGGNNGGNLNLSNGLIADCRIESGYATAAGGGGNVHASGGRVQRCVITDGRSDTGNNNNGFGANILVTANSPVFENCLVTAAKGGYSNKAGKGAIYVKAGSPVFVNCTIAGNTTSVASARGIYLDAAGTKLINCVFYNNGGTAALEWGNKNPDCFVNCAFSAAAKFTGTAPVKTLTDEDFVDLDDFRQVPNTALADAGDNALYAQYALSAEDVRGGARTIGDAIDLGAYEVRGAVTGELTGYDEYEDGEEHTATLTITYPLDAATSTTTKWWSEADGDYTLDEAPKYSEPGIYTVKVKVTGNGLDDFEDEAQVIIHACSVVDATLEGVTVTYDKAAHQAAFTLTDPVDASVLWYNEESGAYDLAQQPAYVNAGVYTTKVEIAKYTYLTKRLEAEVKIEPVELTLAWGPTDLAYTGLAQAPAVTLSGVLANDNVEPVVEGAIVGPDAVGTATVTGLSGAHADNYKLTGDNLSTPFSVGSYAGVVVTLDSPVLEYTGAVLDPGVKVAGINEAVTADMCTFDWGEQGEPKNAGTYELTVTRNDPLYAGKSVKVVVKVNQKPANIVWGPLELPYTGEPAAPSVTLDGIVEGDEVTTSVSGAQSEIGKDYPAELTIGGAAKDNYLFSGETEVEFSIVDKDVFVSLSADGRISVIVKAGVVEEDSAVMIAWDTEDKGATMSAWTNKQQIDTATSEGGTFTADSAPLDIFTGYQVRAFIVASEAIASDAVTYTRPAAGNPTLVCANGAITVTVPKFLLAATGYPLVLAWDTSDQGADVSAWAHTATIEGAVNGLGVTVPVDGFAEGIPAGSMLRAFVSDYSTAAATYLAAVTVEWGSSLLAYTGEEQAPEAKLIGVTDGDDVAADVAGAESEIGGPYTASVTSLTGADAAKYVLVGAPYTLSYGINAGERPLVISGADETIELDDAKVYVFNTVGAGALVTDKQIESADILIVGGGGAGASDVGGGGGGGGVVYLENQTLTAGTHPIVVGAGGAAPTTSSDTGGAKNDGGNGGDSSFADWIGKGGGGGGGWSGRAGKAGGCGGGGHNANGGATTQELYDGAGHGNASVKLSGTSLGTGGAGAGTANNGKTGGNGYLCSITGEDVYYGAGGGGGAGAGGTRGMGGLGGGGNGGDYNTARTAADDASGYGAGGGGGDGKANNTFRTLGGKGYQGIVIVRVANLASVSRLIVASTVDTVTTTVLPDNQATDDLELVLAWDEDADCGEDLALWAHTVAVAAAVTPVGGAYETLLASANIPDGSIVRAFLVKDDAAVDFSPAIQGGLKPVTIEWGGTEFDYSGLPQAPSATVVSGLRDGDVVTVVVEGAQTASGTYTATATGLSGADAAKYKLTGDNLTTTFTIKEYQGIVLVLSTNELVYAGAPISPELTVTAIDEDLSEDDYEIAYSPADHEEVGTYTVRATRKGGVYDGRYVEQTYEILPCPVTVTAQAATKVRLDEDPALPYAVEPALVGTNTFTGALSREVGEEVNTYGYLPGDLAVSGNYVMTLVLDEAVFTITERYPVEATVTGGGNFTYDEATTHTFGTTITTPETGVTVKWAHSDDLEAFLYDAPETFQDVGTYKNVAKFSADHYFDTVVTGQIVIAQKPVSVTAASVAKTYGEDDPEFTYTLGQTIAVSGALGRAAGENAGEYAINLGTLAPASGNYVLQLSGTPKLTINPKPVTVTVDAGPWTKVYGTDDPTFTFTLSETVATTGKLGRDAGETVADSPYAITLGTLSAGANYTLSLATPVPEMTITKATYDMSGVILRDEVSCTVAQLSETPKPYEVTGTLPDGVTASYSGTGTTATEAGTYSVTVHFAGDAVNYEPISDHTLELNVFDEIKPIAATVNDGSAAYDGQMHGPSVEITDPAGGAGCTVVWIDENGTVCGETAPTYTKAGHHESTVTITAKGYEVFEQSVDTFIDDGSIEVMKTGADEGTGPFLTIGYALTVAKEKIAGGAASAKIRVYPGTYEENSLVLDAAIEIVSAGEDRSTVTVHNSDWSKQTFVISAAGAALRHLTIQGAFTGSDQNPTQNLNGQCVKMTADGEVTDCEIFYGISGSKCKGGNIYAEAGRVARCYIHHGDGRHGAVNPGGNVYAMGNTIVENCLLTNGQDGGSGAANGPNCLYGNAKMINCTVVNNVLCGVYCGATTARAINCVIYNNKNGSTDSAATEWGNANASCFVNCAFGANAAYTGTSSTVLDLTDADFADYAGGDYTPKAESALVDAINVESYLETGAGELDIVGNPRIAGAVDFGAYELQPDELTVRVASSTNNVEVGTAVTLTATALSAKGEVAWSWSVNDGEFAAGTATYEVTPSAEDITKVVAKATAGGETATATFEVRAIAADAPVAEVWVGMTGIDVSGAGTELTPFGTIAYAKEFLANHATGEAQTIHLLPGNYIESGIVLDGAYVVRGEGESRDDVIINAMGQGRAFSLSADGAALRDLTVQNGRITSGSGANISMTANGEISNCVIKNGTVYVSDGMGGNVYMTNGSLTDCLLIGGSGNGSNTCKGSAIYATGGRISRCEIREAIYTGAGTKVVDLEGAVVLENSLICKCKAGATANWKPYVLMVNHAGARVVNCTIVDNTTALYGVRVDNASARVINTVIYDNGGSNEKEWGNNNAASFVNCAFGTDAAYTGTSSTVLDLTDADFADYANGDYRPAAGGALEDAGNQTLYAANATSATDLANEPRFVGVLDLGAYEAQPTEFTLQVEASAGVIDPADSSVIKGTVFAAPGEVTWAWKVDNGDFAAGTATYALTGLADGVHTITAKATAGGESLEKTTVVRIASEGSPIAEVWVDSASGDDVKGAGVESSPFATIAHAKALLDAHLAEGAQTIHLAAGTYFERGITLNRALEIVGDPENPESVVVNADSVAGIVFKLTHADAVVRGLTVQNAKGGTGSALTSDITGGSFYVSNGLVEDCVIRNTVSQTNNHGAGAYITGGRMTRCVFRNCNYYGEVAKASAVTMKGGVLENCLFTGNKLTTLHNSNRPGLIAFAGNATVVNCTIVANLQMSYPFYVYSGTPTVINTVMYQNNGASPNVVSEWAGFASGRSIKFVNCAANGAMPTSGIASGSTGNLTELDDSAFVDYEGGDYTPKAGGALMNAGNNDQYEAYATSTTDLAGLPRVILDTIDIGCYEAPATSVIATLDDYEGYADGGAYGAELKISYPLEGAVTKWWDGADYTLDEQPLHTEAGNYVDKVRVTADNLDPFEGEATVTLAVPATMDVTLEGDEVTYDQAEHAATLTVNDPADAEILWWNDETEQFDLEEQPTYVDAGVHVTKVQLKRFGYWPKVLSATVAIEPVELTLTWGSTELSYTGEAQAPAATVADVLAGDDVAPVVTGAATMPGNYKAMVTGLTGADAANYVLTGDNLETDFTIGEYAGVIVKLTSEKLEYTGAPLDPGIELSGIDEDVTADMCDFVWTDLVTLEVVDAPRNAGTYELRVSRKDPSYAGKYVTATFKVGVKPAVLVWGETKLEYTGAEQAPSVALAGMVEGDDVVLTVSGAETEIGTGYTATVELSGDDLANYAVTGETSVEFEIYDPFIEPDYFLLGDDAMNQSSMSGTTGAQGWTTTRGGTTRTVAGATDPTKVYGITNGRMIRTPTTGNYTFQGKTLVVENGSIGHKLPVNSGVLTINDLVVQKNGSCTYSLAVGAGKHIFDGNVTINAGGVFLTRLTATDVRTFECQASIAGPGTLLFDRVSSGADADTWLKGDNSELTGRIVVTNRVLGVSFSTAASYPGDTKKPMADGIELKNSSLLFEASGTIGPNRGIAVVGTEKSKISVKTGEMLTISSPLTGASTANLHFGDSTHKGDVVLSDASADFAGTITVDYGTLYLKGDAAKLYSKCVEIAPGKIVVELPPEDPIVASVANYKGTYDGEPHAAMVTVAEPTEGYTITWDDTSMGATGPAYTDAGSYTNVFTVTATGYLDFVGTGVVEIAEAPVVAYSAEIFTEKATGDTSPSLASAADYAAYFCTAEVAAQIFGSDEVESIAAYLSENYDAGKAALGTSGTLLDATEYSWEQYTFIKYFPTALETAQYLGIVFYDNGTDTEFRVFGSDNAEQGDNYVAFDDEESGTISEWTKPKGLIAATVTNYADTYDGESHAATVTVTKPATGYTITWDDGKTTGVTGPAYKDAGSYTNVFTVTATGYLDFVGTGVVEIAEAPVPTVTVTNATVTAGVDLTNAAVRVSIEVTGAVFEEMKANYTATLTYVDANGETQTYEVKGTNAAWDWSAGTIDLARLPITQGGYLPTRVEIVYDDNKGVVQTNETLTVDVVSGAKALADVWFAETAATVASSPYGTWANAKTAEDRIVTATNTSFTANTASAGNLTVLDFTDVDFGAVAQDRASVPAKAPYAILVETNTVGELRFAIYANGGWTTVSESIAVPELDKTYNLRIVLDTRKNTVRYELRGENDAVTLLGELEGGFAATDTFKTFNLCGDGSLAAFDGECYDGSLVEAKGAKYWTIADALAESDEVKLLADATFTPTAPSGTYRFILDGHTLDVTLPEGWTKTEKDGVITITKERKGKGVIIVIQ